MLLLIPSTVLALVLAAAGLLGIKTYVLNYHLPVQNWLPQGSFLADDQGRPVGWQAGDEMAPQVHLERIGNSPVCFLRLPSGSAETWTDVSVGPGWRSLQVSVWFRSQDVGLELVGRFRKAERVLATERLWLPATNDGRWHTRETMWRVARKSDSLELRVTARGDSGSADLAEVHLTPTFMDTDLPSH